MEPKQLKELLTSTEQISKYQPQEAKITSFPNISETTVAVIKYAVDNTIKQKLLTAPQILIKDATTIIGEILSAYCGATSDGTHSGVVAECVALMTHKFSHMSIHEIREAFRLAAINEIDVDLTAYKGVATVFVFGQVMSKYDAIRKPVAYKVLRESNDESHIRQHNDLVKKEEFSKMILNWFEESKKTKGRNIKGVNDIPFYYYDALAEDGVITVDIETKRLYLEKALILIKNKFDVMSLKKQDRVYLQQIDELGTIAAYRSMSRETQSEITSLAKRQYLYDLFTNTNDEL